MWDGNLKKFTSWIFEEINDIKHPPLGALSDLLTAPSAYKLQYRIVKFFLEFYIF